MRYRYVMADKEKSKSGARHPHHSSRKKASARNSAESADQPAEVTDWRRLHLWQIQPLRDIAVIAAVILFVMLGYWLSAITVPLLIALTLAYLTEPVIEKCEERFRWNRRKSVLILLVLSVTVALVFVLTALPIVVGQTLRLIQMIPSYIDKTLVYVSEHKNAESLQEFLETARQWVQGNAASKAGPAVATVGEAVRMIAGFAGSLFYFLFMVFLIPFYYYFIALSYPRIIHYAAALIRKDKQPRVFELVGKMDRAVSGFVRGRLVICFILGLIYSVGWWICGVPYWLLLGMATGVLSLVPYLGTVGLPLAVGLLFFRITQQADADQNVNYWLLVWPAVVFFVVQFIEGYVLIPLIQGKATNLDPVTLLVAVLAGGTIMGIYGMLLAIPVAACIKILLTDVVWPKVQEWSAGRAEDPLPISRE